MLLELALSTLDDMSEETKSLRFTMANQVQYIVEWTIAEGGLARFKELAQSVIRAVEAKEPKMLNYQWYFSEDETKCYLIESYADADAIVSHLQNVGEALNEFFEVSQITRFEVFGDLTDGARNALAPLGPAMFSHWNGFTR